MVTNLSVPGLAFALALLLSACDRPTASSAPAPGPEPAATPVAAPPPVQYHLNHAQPKLRTMKLWLGPKEVEAELAVSLTEISTGMMFRTNMPNDTGMLFVFARPNRREFYMKNCVIGLSTAYIDADGVIDELIELHPGVEKPVPSRSDQIKYVLEMPKGWFESNKIGVGTMINTARGPLKNLSGVLP